MCEAETSIRPRFGDRMLKEGEDVFQHNAWDNVEWGQEQESEAQAAVDRGRVILVEEELAKEYESNAGQFWDKFYSIHQNRFFKERNWLFTEFPDLAPGYKGAMRVYGKDNNDSGDNSENSKTTSDVSSKKPSDFINQSDIDNLR